jgi:hypothetical protein
MRWAGHVVRMGENTRALIVLMENMKGGEREFG